MNSLHRRLTCRILVLGLAMAPSPQLLSGQVYTVLHDLNGTSMEPPIAGITVPYRVETEMFTAHCAAGESTMPASYSR